MPFTLYPALTLKKNGKTLMIRSFITIITACALLNGCVTINSSPVSVTKIASIDASTRELTFLSGTPYLAQLTLALTKSGFKVLPMATQYSNSSQPNDSSTRSVHSSARYGLVFTTISTRQFCVFTDHVIINATANIIDTKSNETVAILTQRGSDGPCSTVEPVFETMASELSRIWK